VVHRSDTPEFAGFGSLVREDLLSIELRKGEPLQFSHTSRSESLTLWYEPIAEKVCPPEGVKKWKTRDWKPFWNGPHGKAPGLYAKVLPYEPDYVLTLNVGGSVAMAVGDAIFSTGTERADPGSHTKDVINKGGKVKDNYVANLVLVLDDGRAVFPFEHGFVVFCGDPSAASILEKDPSANDISFLALRPSVDGAETGHGAFACLAVEEHAVRAVEEYLGELREHLGFSELLP